MKLILSTLFVWLTFTGIAQVNIVNRSLTNDTLSILYSGVDNEIEIAGYSVKPKSIISITGGSISTLNPITYLVRTGSDSTAIIMIKEKSKTVFTRRFTVENIPDPVAIVGDIRDTIATVQQILASGMLKIEFPNSYYRHTATISSFDVTVIKGDKFTDIRSSHYIFPPEMTKVIGELAPGDKLIFNNIRMIQPGGRNRQLAAFQLRIM
jgi:hypothetical protein